MAVMSPGRAATEEAVSASLHVVESARALARVETKLSALRGIRASEKNAGGAP
jgi:hypothetical protein